MNKKDIKKYVLRVCSSSYEASKVARTLSNAQRNKIISSIIASLRKDKNTIFRKNEIDIKAAKTKKMSESLIDRLLINDKRISSMIDGLKKLSPYQTPYSRKSIKLFSQVESLSNK